MDNGGPAFPTTLLAAQQGFDGMSLRDYFAGQTLPTCLAVSVAEMDKTGYPDGHWREGVAMDAYAMADAMLRARAKGENDGQH